MTGRAAMITCRKVATGTLAALGILGSEVAFSQLTRRPLLDDDRGWPIIPLSGCAGSFAQAAAYVDIGPDLVASAQRNCAALINMFDSKIFPFFNNRRRVDLPEKDRRLQKVWILFDRVHGNERIYPNVPKDSYLSFYRKTLIGDVLEDAIVFDIGLFDERSAKQYLVHEYVHLLRARYATEESWLDEGLARLGVWLHFRQNFPKRAFSKWLERSDRSLVEIVGHERPQSYFHVFFFLSYLAANFKFADEIRDEPSDEPPATTLFYRLLTSSDVGTANINSALGFGVQFETVPFKKPAYTFTSAFVNFALGILANRYRMVISSHGLLTVPLAPTAEAELQENLKVAALPALATEQTVRPMAASYFRGEIGCYLFNSPQRLLATVQILPQSPTDAVHRLSHGSKFCFSPDSGAQWLVVVNPTKESVAWSLLPL